jgi:hypothetical protein
MRPPVIAAFWAAALVWPSVTLAHDGLQRSLPAKDAPADALSATH